MGSHKHGARVLVALLGVMVGAIGFGASATPPELPLWPEGQMVPLAKPEEIHTNAGGAFGKAWHSVFNVSQPTISPYLLPAATSPAPAVVICPGGAYGGLAIDIEGSDVARWLNTVGVAGVVLKYRVPMRKGDGKHRLPLQDVQRAISYVRARAREWNLDPQRIGVLGFSAGGHLAANVSKNNDPRAYDAVDETDRVSCRPDFSVLVYPAYLLLNGKGPELAPELKVTSNAPPTFLVHAEDDPIGAENSLFYSLALKQAKVPAYLVLFPSGGHGYGLGIRGGIVTTWPQHCQAWMRDRGIIP